MKMHGWGVGTMAGVGVLAAWFVACAGETIPTIDEELRQDIEEVYDEGAGGQVGNAGSAGASGGGAAGAGGGGEPSDGGAAGAGGGAAGAGGGEPVGGGGGGGGGDLCDAYNTVLVPSCGLSGCHADGSSQGAFAVDGDESVVEDFINRPSNLDTCDLLYINSADTEQSLILRRTDEQQVQGCGQTGQMPLTGDLLTPDQVECLTDWLTQFAD